MGLVALCNYRRRTIIINQLINFHCNEENLYFINHVSVGQLSLGR